MADNGLDRIAIIELNQKDVDMGGLHTLRDIVNGYFNRTLGNGEYQVRIESQHRRLVLYVRHPVNNMLEELARTQANSRWPISYSLETENRHDSKEAQVGGEHVPVEEYQRVTEQYALLEMELQRLSSDHNALLELAAEQGSETTRMNTELAGANITIRDLTTRVDELLAQNLELESQVPYVLLRNVRPDQMQYALERNQKVSVEALSNLVDSVFTVVSAEVAAREWYTQTPEILQARQTIAEKNEYLEKHGIEAFNDLPQVAKAALEQSWRSAELSVAEYEHKRDSIPYLDFPILVTLNPEGTMVTLPVSTDTKNEIASRVYQGLESLKSKLEGYGITSDIQNEEFFGLIVLGHAIKYQDLEDMMITEYGEVLNVAKLNVRIYPITVLDLHATGSAYTPPKQIEVEKNPLESLILDRLHQMPLDVQTEERLYVIGQLYDISKGALPHKRTRLRLAEILGIDMKDIEERLKPDFQYGTNS